MTTIAEIQKTQHLDDTDKMIIARQAAKFLFDAFEGREELPTPRRRFDKLNNQVTAINFAVTALVDRFAPENTVYNSHDLYEIGKLITDTFETMGIKTRMAMHGRFHLHKIQFDDDFQASRTLTHIYLEA